MMGSRHVEWHVTVTRRDSSILKPVLTGGRMDWGITNDSIAGGSFSTSTDLGNLIGATIEPVQIINGTSYPMGVFQATADPARLGAAASWSVEFIDPTIQLARVKLQSPLSLPVATPVVRKAREFMGALGLTVAIPDSDVTLRVALAFDAGTSWLEVISTMLGAARLSKVRARPGGLAVERLLALDELPETWRLSEGVNSVQVLDYAFDSDHLATPNRVQVSTRGDSSNPVLVGTAMDRATSPWSYESRGYWVDAEGGTSEVTTQADVNAEARRLLVERMARSETLTVKHAWLPEAEVGSVGRFESDRHPRLSGLWQIQNQTLDMTATSLASSTLRKVVAL